MLPWWDATLILVKILVKEGCSETKLCGRLRYGKMEKFVVALKNLSFYSFKKMLDVETSLDNQPMDFMILQKFLG